MSKDKYYKRRCRRIFTSVLNSLFTIIDVAIIATIFIAFVITILLFIAVFCKILKIDADILKFIGEKYRIYKLGDLVALLASFFSIAFAPIISIIVATLTDSRKKTEEINQQFSRFNNLSFYIVCLPFGAWNNLIVNYNKFCKEYNVERRPISYYDYCLCFVFQNECFQSYDVNLQRVLCNDNGKIKAVRDEDSKDNIPFFISDTTGIERSDGSSQLAILIKEREEINEYFLKNNTKGKDITLIFSLRPRISKSYEKFIGCIEGKYVYHFPFIRSMICTWIAELIQKTKLHKVKLSFETAPKSIDKEKNKFEFKISDIDVAAIKERPFKIYKKRKKG